MLDLLLYVLGALLLFLVGFPLAGLIVGFVLRICLPYLAGPAALFLATRSFGSAWAWWVPALLSAVWIISIVQVRQRLGRNHGGLHWSEGHFNGAVNIVTFAGPLRRGKLIGQRPARSRI